MLVLARRPSQSIVFPQLGITIQVVESSGSMTRLGVTAPREIKVLREELYDKLLDADSDAPTLESRLDSRERHALRNRLNSANMAIHLARRHLQAARNEEAQAALDTAVAEFRDLNYIVKSYGENPVRVLLVEDDTNERELLAGYLRTSGYEVSTAANGEEAVEYLSSEARPDVVLLDMLMPRFDGAQTIKRIRETPHLFGLKVFAVSGTNPEDFGVSTGPRGVDGWFNKPLDPERLVTALRRDLAPATPA
ncbi:MAG: response regulator [Fuerstiella sp.]